jgi:hypothetical protein
MKRLWRVVLLILAVLGLLLAGPAFAQGGDDDVIELEGLVIEGKIAKPQVFYVLGRSTIRYEHLQLDQSFVHRIVQSAKTNPF